MTPPQATPAPTGFAGMTARAALTAAIVVAAAAMLPWLLSGYQVGLATEVLIFGILAMSIDILAGFAGRTSLGPRRDLWRLHLCGGLCDRAGGTLAGGSLCRRRAHRDTGGDDLRIARGAHPPVCTSCCSHWRWA